MLKHIDLLNVQTLDFWEKVQNNTIYLVMVYYPSYIFLDLIHLLVDILPHIYEEYWSEIFLSTNTVICNGGLKEWIPKYSFLFSFLKEFVCSFFVKCLIDFPKESIQSFEFFFWESC